MSNETNTPCHVVAAPQGLEVLLDGRLGDAEFSGDLLVGAAVIHEVQDAPLLCRERPPSGYSFPPGALLAV